MQENGLPVLPYLYMNMLWQIACMATWMRLSNPDYVPTLQKIVHAAHNVQHILTVSASTTLNTPSETSLWTLTSMCTRSSALLHIVQRLGHFSWDLDVQSMLERALLTEFLPVTAKVDIEELLKPSRIKKVSPRVCVLLAFTMWM
jgi:hypothetical protein